MQRVLEKVALRRLAIHTLPLAAPLDEGGRILMPAGEVAQLVSGPTMRYLAYLEFLHQPHVVRGNHYHQHKVESLYVLRGHLHARYQDIATQEQAELTLEAGDLVLTHPGCAHAYRPLAYSQALEFAPTPFDPSDTYRYMLEEPHAG
jgi:quercetin dioxygenase-like cupin family protein